MQDAAVGAAIPITGASLDSPSASASGAARDHPSEALHHCHAPLCGGDLSVQDATVQACQPFSTGELSAPMPPQQHIETSASAAEAVPRLAVATTEELDFDPSLACAVCGAARARADAAFCHRCGQPLWMVHAQGPPPQSSSYACLERSASAGAIGGGASSGGSPGAHRVAPTLPQQPPPSRRPLSEKPPLPERPPLKPNSWPDTDMPQPLGFGSTAPQRHGLTGRGSNNGFRPEHRRAPILRPSASSHSGGPGRPSPQNRYLELVLQEERALHGENRRPSRPRAPPPLVQPRMVFGGGSVAPVRNPPNPPITITLPDGSKHRAAPHLPAGMAANPLDGHSQISRAQQAAAKAATGAAITSYLNPGPGAPSYRAPPTLLAGSGGMKVVPPQPRPRPITGWAHADQRVDFRQRSEYTRGPRTQSAAEISPCTPCTPPDALDTSETLRHRVSPLPLSAVFRVPAPFLLCALLSSRVCSVYVLAPPLSRAVLDSPIVRSMLTTAQQALSRQAREHPEDTPNVLVLVEIATKSSGISIHHDKQLYNSYYARVAQAIGDRILSPEDGSDAFLTAMVSLTPRPEANALQRGLRDSAPPPGRDKLFADNVAFNFATECRLGAFEVYVVTQFPYDGSASMVPRVAGLHSKLWTRKFPNVQKLVRGCQELLLPIFRRQDGDAAVGRLLQATPVDGAALRHVLEAYESYLSPGLAEEATARLLAFDEAEAELREAIRAVSALPPPPPASGGQEASGGKQQLDTTAQTLRDAIARCSGHASAATIEEAEDTLEALCPLELELEPG